MLGRYSKIAILSIFILMLLAPATWGATNKNFLLNIANLNGTPIEGAEVRLSLQSDTNYQRSGNSNSRGELLFENIAEGTYTVTIIKSGFVTVLENLDITPISSKTFYLRNTGFKIISGQVYKDSNDNKLFDSGESGIPKAIVKVTNTVTNETYSVNTDQNGQFRIQVPEGQNYKINVSYSTSDYEVPTAVTPIDTVDYSVVVPLIIKGKVYGKVTTDDDKPLFGIQVFLKGTTVSYTSTDLGGFFRFSVKPGTYFVEVEFFDYEKYTTEPFNLEQEEQKEVTIVLSKQRGTLTYEIKTEDGRALSEVDAEIIKTGSGVLVEKITKANGTIQLVPGVYTLKADAKGYDPSEINFEITKAGLSRSLTLKQANGSLKVSLKDPKGNPISGVSILIDGVQKGTSDNSGTIVISGLPPKEYQVVASSTLYGKVTQIVKVEGETEKDINLVLESNILIQGLPIIIIAVFFLIIALLKKNIKHIGLPKKEPIQPVEKPKLQEITTQTYSQEIPQRQPFIEEKPVPIKKSKLKTKRPLRGLPKKPSKNKENP
ncbi:MAG: Cna protein B-type domain protein [Candidatus Methanofastidiosum methylothiophilum]|uniref:Cna protein B-type domain protein n=1 Tax=Candidatus Methanofastidiosum methylothiophilum TaxID=1705564 RepID=A0A150IKW9_9EURY|nr:MAG: Cna protein B-type domain protein [Candidatus Methanofastidiosum methylthiophilus]KYC47957.1 MAG: Cna protein B-type domain protein [Candidatus Methanofastidiosum methylthiophilus]KYC50575.1 MAG: Cna protein B-type domain protein [Candidatus Methanofastidiosum methylthiophilus]